MSGIAGLLFSLVPTASPAQVAGALEQGAVPAQGVAFGRVDAAAALASLVPLAPSLPPVDAGSTKPSVGVASTTTLTRSGRLGTHGRTISFTTGPGRLVATLTVGAGRGGRSRLTLRRGARRVAVATGQRQVRLRAIVRRGRYVLRVAGPVGASFVLRIRHPRERGAGN